MEEKDLKDYLAAFKRHRPRVLMIASGVFILSLLIAVLWPATYRSSATILIEEQEIPTELVRSTITTYAAQRLQMINQRVMTRTNLEKIINKFNLYSKEKKKNTTEEIVEKMRKDMDFLPISAEVIDPRTGQPSKAVIAFSLSYDGEYPELVQQVANEVTSLYLEENLKQRTQKTEETSVFLKEESKQMGEYVSQLEKKLSDFKEQHIRSLPEQKDLNLQFMDRTERDIADLDTQVHNLEERRFYLEGQLAQIKPETSMTSASGERILGPRDRLKVLETEYISLSSKYSQMHPDVVRIRQEIESLNRETGGGSSSTALVDELAKLRTELASVSDRYSENHPDVKRLKKQIAHLENSLSEKSHFNSTKATAENTAPENPAYITLKAQLDGTIQDIASMTTKKSELKAKLVSYEKRLSESPDVERQYLGLVRDYENSALKYRELKAKEMEAQIAEQLEKKSKGERFSVIEPPMLPEKPVKPNRLVIALLGLILAIMAATGYFLLKEAADTTVRGIKSVAAIAGHPPLASIPIWATDEEHSVNSRNKTIVILVALGLLVLALSLIHWLWIPFDVLWFRALRKLDNVLG